MDSTDIGTILLLIVFLGLSAFFSATETAFSTVNTLRIRNMADEGSTKAKAALRLMNDYDRLLSTILIGNNLVNIALSSVITVVATDFFGSAGVAIATGASTLLVLTFGEILPKSLAKDHSERIVLSDVTSALRFFVVILYPFSAFFSWLKGLLRGKNTGEKAPSITEQELLYMLETMDDNVLEDEEKDLVQSALEFDETTVQEVLTPRVNVFALDIEDDQEEILGSIMGESFSRIPVYEDTIDNIIGIVQSREILEKAVQGQKIDLRGMMGDVMYVHRTMKISRLLGDFQRSKTHMAVVIDDYGGTLGVVTLEDLLEELVGEIWDEDDEVVTDLVDLGDGSFEVSGDMNIYEFFDAMHYDARRFESDYNTMNGWALELLEHIPEVGEHFSYDRFAFTVKEMDDQRITKLLVRENPPAEEG